MQLLADMELFVRVCELQNFGRAAESLNLTPSTVSRRIAGLERELGLALVRRSTRSFFLTAAGQCFFERSRMLVHGATQAREEISSSFTKIAGHVRAGSPSDLATTILAPAFAKFCRDNAEVSLDIVSTQGQPNLDRDKLDVAFAVTHQVSMPDSSFATRSIGSFERMLYASRAYLKRHGTPLLPQDLELHNCIRYLESTVETKWRLVRDKRAQTVLVSGPCASSSVIVSAQAAREHIGIAILPLHLASHPTYGAGLIRVLPEWKATPVNVFAITADRKLPARIEEIIRVARSEFGRRLEKLESVAAQP